MKDRKARGSGDDSRREAAQALAITALSFLASDPERFGRFLAVTGVGPEQIRDAAREQGFLAGVLDHIGADEPLLIEFAAHAELKPASVMAAATILGGGAWERDVP
jgi:Protein of unknown function (DUF3572)